MGSKYATAARIAWRQHGRVARRQLVEAGVDRHTIQRWLADGRLRAVHRGVYALGHAAPSVDGSYMAAVLAGGPGAVLSHLAAAHKLRIVAALPALPEVTIATTAHRCRPGIVVHRVRTLPSLDVSMLDGIAITTVPRTLLDLAPRLAPKDLTRVGHEAWVRHRTTLELVEACIARNPTKKGAARLRRALGADVTLSALEDDFLALLRRHGVPSPRTNVDRHGDKVDCHWPRHGVTVELVSFRYHATRHGFEQDVARRRRSDHLAFTFGDVHERGDATVATLRQRFAATALDRRAYAT